MIFKLDNFPIPEVDGLLKALEESQFCTLVSQSDAIFGEGYVDIEIEAPALYFIYGLGQAAGQFKLEEALMPVMEMADATIESFNPSKN